MLNGYKIIAFCLPRAYEDLNFDIIASLNAKALKYGYRIFIYHSCTDFFWHKDSENTEKAVFELMDFSVIDLTIIYDERYYDKELTGNIADKSLENNVPVILIGSERKGCITLKFDYESGFESIVRHVVEYHNIRDVFLVAGTKGNEFSERRIAIYKKVLEENNIPFNENSLDYGDYWWGPTIKIMERLYNEHRLPKAVICINDSMAVTVCGFLHEKGIKIPSDIIVTGFDGIMDAQFSIPPITTAALDLDKLSDTIIDIAQKVTNKEKTEKEYVVNYSLEIYESCGCKNSHPQLNTAKLLKDIEEDFRNYQENDSVFFNLSEYAMNCSEPEELVKIFNKSVYYNTSVLVNGSTFDKSIDPSEKPDLKCAFDDYMMLLYETSDNSGKYKYPMFIERKKLLPDIDEILKKGNPLLFNTLGFMGIPYGFMCSYSDLNKNTYKVVPQYVSSFNYSIGCYRNMNYARYVSKNIEVAASHDFMTGLLNRSGFYSEIKNLLKNSTDSDYMTVALADLDGLKVINDNYGHDSGDFAINTLSRAINFIQINSVRKICGRFGGDEFVVCIISSDDKKTESQIRKDILKYIDIVNSTESHPFKVSASIGIASAPINFADFDTLKNLADDRMYEEKMTKPNHRRCSR